MQQTPADSAKLPDRQFKYAYDNAGNRTSASVIGEAQDNVHTTNNLNQIVSRQNKYVVLSGTATASQIVVAGQKTQAPKQQNFWSQRVARTESDTAPSYLAYTIQALASGSNVRTDTRSLFVPPYQATLTYDDDGNLKADGVWDYVYDAENQLVSMTTVSALTADSAKRKLEFRYDHQGRRFEKKVSTWVSGAWSLQSTRRYLYDGWNLVAEFSFSGGSLTLARSYTWALDLGGSFTGASSPGSLVQVVVHGSTPKAFYPTYDGSGNVASLLSAADGSVAAAYEYSPFGEPLRAQTIDADLADQPFRFSTKFTDVETGLIYYGMRYYSPAMGRFINRDPIAEAGGINLYGFCGNDGINHSDVLGMLPTLREMAYDLYYSGNQFDSYFDYASTPISDDDRRRFRNDYWFDDDNFLMLHSSYIRMVWINLFNNGYDDGSGDPSGNVNPATSVTNTSNNNNSNTTNNNSNTVTTTTSVIPGATQTLPNVTNMSVPGTVGAGIGVMASVGVAAPVVPSQPLSGVSGSEALRNAGLHAPNTSPSISGNPAAAATTAAAGITQGTIAQQEARVLGIQTAREAYIRGDISAEQYVLIGERIRNMQLPDYGMAQGGGAQTRRVAQSSAEAQIAEARAANVASGRQPIPGDALVVKGGLALNSTIDTFEEPGLGTITGTSVNSNPGKSVEELSRSLPHNQIRVTTVAQVRKAGGNVVPARRSTNPDHATLTGLSPSQINSVLGPPIPNPNVGR